MKIPAFLKKGDLIGITCPAGYVSETRIACAVETMKQWGFRVLPGNTVGTGAHYFSGTDAERLADMQAMLDNPEIKAILMGRGGYGSSRIIDQLDFSSFIKNPKWICGFSDITVFHSHIQQNFEIATLHSPMCGAFTPESESGNTIQSLYKALTGQELYYNFPASDFNKTGEVEGVITGGNLAILGHLTGSVSQVVTDGKILFIEDIGEHLYNIDRLLLNLKRSGQLRGIKALLVGSFTDMEDTERPFGKSLEQIISEMVDEYNIPVAFNFPCGHDEENVSLPMGVPARLRIGNEASELYIRLQPDQS